MLKIYINHFFAVILFFLTVSTLSNPVYAHETNDDYQNTESSIRRRHTESTNSHLREQIELNQRARLNSWKLQTLNRLIVVSSIVLLGVAYYRFIQYSSISETIGSSNFGGGAGISWE